MVKARRVWARHSGTGLGRAWLGMAGHGWEWQRKVAARWAKYLSVRNDSGRSWLVLAGRVNVRQGESWQGKEFLTQEEIMQLPDVLSAAMALTAEERLRLVDAIALVDDWQIDIVDKPKTITEAIAEDRPIATGIDPANKWKGFKHYKGESLEILRRAYSRYSNQLATGEERRRIVAETAEQLGRSYSGIYNKFLEMQNGQKK